MNQLNALLLLLGIGYTQLLTLLQHGNNALHHLTQQGLAALLGDGQLLLAGLGGIFGN